MFEEYRFSAPPDASEAYDIIKSRECNKIIYSTMAKVLTHMPTISPPSLINIAIQTAKWKKMNYISHVLFTDEIIVYYHKDIGDFTYVKWGDINDIGGPLLGMFNMNILSGQPTPWGPEAITILKGDGETIESFSARKKCFYLTMFPRFILKKEAWFKERFPNPLGPEDKKEKVIWRKTSAIVERTRRKLNKMAKKAKIPVSELFSDVEW